MIKNILIILTFILTTGCESIFGPEITCVEGDCNSGLELTTDYPLDENGYYHFQLTGEFDETTYGRVDVISGPVQRVYWASIDSFTVYHMGFPITEPIIQHSSYTDDGGNASQYFWIDLNAVGDTLTVHGSLNSTLQTCEWYDGVNDCEYYYSQISEKINIIIN
tara:strand:- start:3038 stop:3529 length:492 start_codon:yes stop_codon:yes gene_type:complete